MSNPSPYGSSGGQHTPWPQYGENVDVPQGYPGAADQDYPGAADQGYTGSPGAGYGSPIVELPPMPSRAPGITTLVIGIVAMLVIAPITLVVTLIAGLGSTFDQLAGSDGGLRNGDTVSVSEGGDFTVLITDGLANSCSLTDANGAGYVMNAYQGDSSIFSITGISPGNYQLSCDGLSSGAQVVGLGMSPDEAGMAFIVPFVWATVVGVIGLIVMIVGIVLLVRVNRKRRELTQQAMMSVYR